MRTKVTLVLLFLNVALFFFIFKFERTWRTEEASREARRRVLGAEAADIRVLEVTGATPATSYRLERIRESWHLKKPLDWPANDRAAASIALELATLDHETSFTVADLARTKQSLADFGLDKPKLVVGFASGDPAVAGAAPKPLTRLRIGDASPDGKRYYVLSPDGERIHVVNRALVDRLSVPLDQLRADTLLTVRIYDARSLAVQTTGIDPAGGKTAAGLRTRILRDINTNRWTFAAPITAPASRTAVELVLNELNTLKVKSFPAAPPATLPSASFTLRVSLEGNNRSETLFIGDPVPAAAPAPNAPRPATPPAPSKQTEYYAQLDDRAALFTVMVDADLIARLRNAQESLREKRILDFDPRAVTEMVLASPMQPNLPPLTLQRLDPPAGQAREAAPRWQIVRRGEGTQGPQTLPADPATIQRVLDRLSLLHAETFKSDTPTNADAEEWGFNRPLRDVTLTIAGNAAPTTLRIGTDASRRTYYARVRSPSDTGIPVYTISPDVVDELALAPTAWRHRALAEPLPEAAQITALKLTDLNGNKPLFEAAFAGNGEITPRPSDPKPVQEVVRALRQLRAKEFLPGGFTERIFAAGDERPWRFQLEATVSLPGGAGAAQTNTLTLFLTERLGGSQQFAGSKDLDTVFALEQPLIDALWSLAYGTRDPGPPASDRKQ